MVIFPSGYTAIEPPDALNNVNDVLVDKEGKLVYLTDYQIFTRDEQNINTTATLKTKKIDFGKNELYKKLNSVRLEYKGNCKIRIDLIAFAEQSGTIKSKILYIDPPEALERINRVYNIALIDRMPFQYMQISIESKNNFILYFIEFDYDYLYNEDKGGIDEE